MIPLRDSVRPERKPIINWFLILVNFFCFFYELKLTEPQLNQLFYHFGIIPAGVTAVINGLYSPVYLATFFTAMFYLKFEQFTLLPVNKPSNNQHFGF